MDSFDTNVVIYLLSSEPTRIAKSKALLSKPGVVSVQVFNEFIAALRSGKRSNPPNWSAIDNVLAFLRANHRVVPVDLATHSRARMYAERYQIKVYDANIVAAAVLAGCTTLWSEDMNAGQVIDGLTIRNPYAGL